MKESVGRDEGRRMEGKRGMNEGRRKGMGERGADGRNL